MSSTDENASPDADREDRPLTLAQLADHAGVSIATVSKVVNGRDSVAPETRKLVEGLIRRYGYRRQKRPVKAAPLVDVVFHELRGLYGIEIINGVEAVARRHHLRVVVSELGGRRTPGRGWVEDVLTTRPIGVIAVFAELTADQHQQFRSRGIPLVFVDPADDPEPESASVGANNWSGGLAATRHLLGLGHRRIAVITGPEHVLSARARLDGYRAALDLAGVPVDPALVRIGDYQIADGLHHTRELLRLSDPPTAIVAGNDGEALGAYQAAAEAGLRIPDDLSVVGYDDLPMAEWTIPPLTTIRQPLREMASSAAEMLLTLAHGEPLPHQRVELATELIVRGSTAPPSHL
ncbi:LacI family DNA-binding transcriptional regulator [Glycomyces buryatensis]|uniref:LacI family transcriptional regulator n=1 Tax=Glycomyces buryatensis TaxID=2570927 RepID=A0A4S8PXK3_9ACTN|nr:LacI family DNA-binding transcriptional regulator [Glycomyces buryatensis]THV36433.1 LacI family transcriptional regulator [Glycomyces buryatensis]